VAERIERDDNDGLVVMRFGLCVEAERCSCILPFFAVLDPLSLPLPVCLLLVLFLELRSSVTLDEPTSLRSSSEVL
jgi:hypothetical protein